MAILTSLRRLLDGNHIPYEVHAHAEAYKATDVAAADHVPPSEMVKVVVLRSGGRFLMAAIPASRRIDLERLCDTVGDAGLRLATEGELAEAFPACERGAMPPFGALFGMPLWVDDALGRETETVFNAGNHRETVHMAYQDFVRLAQPQFGAFTRRQDELGH